MLLQVILEGIGLGVLLILVCTIGIRKGAVGMVHLYSQEVQERCVTLGLTTHAKIKAKCFDFQSCLRPRLHRLCAGLRLCAQRRKGLRSGLLAAAGHTFGHESDRPIFDRRLLGGLHERVDNSRHRGLEALYYRQGQGEKVAVRHGGDGGHFGSTGGDYDAFYENMR